MTTPTTLSSLPPELLHQILQYLPSETLSTLSTLSTHFRHHSLDPALWHSLPYQTYLIQRAWRLARAHHSFLPAFSPPIHSLILPDSSRRTCLAACLETSWFRHLTIRAKNRISIVTPPHKSNLLVSRSGPNSSAYHLFSHPPSLSFYCHDENCSPTRIPLPVPAPTGLITSIEILPSAGAPPPVVLGTSTGSIHLVTSSNSTTMTISHHPISSLCATSPSSVLIGTQGGLVLHFDLSQAMPIRQFIGPCQCGVAALERNSPNVITAGYSHRTRGNGHCAMAIAWDMRVGTRLAAFGRGNRVGQDGLVRMIRGDGGVGKRVAVVGGGMVKVFDIGMGWKCQVQLEGGNGGVDMNHGVLGVAKEGGVDLWDFARAIKGWPKEAVSVGPRERTG